MSDILVGLTIFVCILVVIAIMSVIVILVRDKKAEQKLNRGRHVAPQYYADYKRSRNNGKAD